MFRLAAASFFILSFACFLLAEKIGRSKLVDRCSEQSSIYAELKNGWDRLYAVSKADLQNLRNEVSEVFDENYANYLKHAFPMDELLPISCRGVNTEGGISITLLDTLDTLIVMNRSAEIKKSIELIKKHVTFDIDHLANVFEVNIRALGGLLSAHVLLKRNPSIVEDYDGSLLTAALDLGERLFAAFDGTSSIPTGRINLRTGKVSDSDGHVPHDITETCSACAGTLLLEMGMLSRLTGLPKFERKAKEAIQTLFNIRSELDLIGTIIDIEEEHWKVEISTIGAGTDSLFEYLLKGFLLFGEEEYLHMFVDLYVAVMHHMQTPKLLGGYRWLVDAHAFEGYLFGPWVSSLSSFWPGMQALAGQLEDARHLHANYSSIWMNFAALPELFSIDGERANPRGSSYPLRPEHIESTFYLYASTHEPHFLQMGRAFQRSLLSTNTYHCGHATIKDVATGELDDSMASFFLSETLKYLFLLTSNTTSFIDAFVFTTEAHIFPPLPSKRLHETEPSQLVPSECHSVCVDHTEEQLENELKDLHLKFPLLRVTTEDLTLLRSRRCTACTHIALRRMEDHGFSIIDEAWRTRYINWAIHQHSGDRTQKKSEKKSQRDRGLETTATLKCSLKTEIDSDVVTCSDFSLVHANNVILPTPRSSPEHAFVSLQRPGGEHYGGRLLILLNDGTTEVSGRFQPYHYLAKDTSLSENCPAKVLVKLTEPTSSFLRVPKSCNSFIVHGPLRLVHPLSSCGRLKNAKDLKNSIAVMDDVCTNPEKAKQIEEAGAQGIVVLKTTPSKESTSVLQQAVNIPILLIPVHAYQQVMKNLVERDDAKAMMGSPVSGSLTTCLYDRPRLQRIPKQESCCPVDIRLTIPFNTQQKLLEHFSAEDLPHVLSAFKQNLKKNDAIFQALFDAEQ